MYVRKTGEVWEVLAPAKLNLYLEVLGRRSDGFHELETLLAPISCYDRLQWRPEETSAEPSHRFGLSYDLHASAHLASLAPADERNLVWRAVVALANAAGFDPRGHFTLFKRIPVQAGLGGGSSNAAAALVLANQAWGIGYSTARLGEIAATLGSDVPFFMARRTAVCQGRGERVTPVDAMPRLNVVVVVPRSGIATAEAFQSLQASPLLGERSPGFSDRLADLIVALRRGAFAKAARLMVNRLQDAAMRLCPDIARIHAILADYGCYARQLTGSGSAYFGVMRSALHARRAAMHLSSANLGCVFAAATCR